MNNLHKFHRTYARFNKKRRMNLEFLRRQWRRADEAFGPLRQDDNKPLSAIDAPNPHSNRSTGHF